MTFQASHQIHGLKDGEAGPPRISIIVTADFNTWEGALDDLRHGYRTAYCVRTLLRAVLDAGSRAISDIRMPDREPQA